MKTKLISITMLCFAFLSFVLGSKSINSTAAQAKEIYRSVEDIFNENASLNYGDYSSNEYSIKGFVLDVPTLKTDNNKISFILVDDINTPSDNELVVFSSLSLQDIHQYDEVIVNGYIRYLNSNKMMISSYESSICTTTLVTCDHTSGYSEKTETVRMIDIATYFAEKSEHTPFSNKFQKDYQQEKGGYIDNAKKAGITIDKSICSPNQKWHFFESWFFPSIGDSSLTWQEDAKNRVYTRIQCPELLLWIYESSDVDSNKVEIAYQIAVSGELNSLSTATIAKNIREVISWDDLKSNILSEYKINNVESLDLNVLDTYTLQPKLNNKDAIFDFEVEDETIINVSASGLITALKIGITSVDIYLSTNHDIKKTIFINVFDHGSEAFPINVSEAIAEIGKTLNSNEFYSTNPLYIKGVVSTSINEVNEFTIKDMLYDSTIKVLGLNEEETPYQNDTITIKGYIKKTQNGFALIGKEDEHLDLISLVRGQSCLTSDSIDDLTLLVNNAPFVNKMKLLNNSVVELTIISEKEINKVIVNNIVLDLNDGKYTFIMKGDCYLEITFSKEGGLSSFYDVIGNGKKGGDLDIDSFKTVLDLKDGDEDIISSIDSLNYVYSGAYGGRGDTYWSKTDMLKIGTTSNAGSISFTTSTKINFMTINALSYGGKCDIKVGDTSHYDEEGYYQTISSTTLETVSSDVITKGVFDTVKFDFNATKNITISISKKVPLYIKSFTLGYEDDIDQTTVIRKDGSYIKVDESVVGACDIAYKTLYESSDLSICREGYTIQEEDWNNIKQIFVSRSIDITILKDVLAIENSEIIIHKFLYRYDYIVAVFNMENFIIGRQINVSDAARLESIYQTNFDFISAISILTCSSLLVLLAFKCLRKDKFKD